MALLSLLTPRARNKQSVSSLSLQTELSSTTHTLSPSTSASTSPRTRKRLRKRPTLPHQKPSPKEEEAVTSHSQTATPVPCLSRGTLGGFCAIDDLERNQTPVPEPKESVMRSVGRKIGLGLWLQNDSPTDLTHVVDAPESWYISYTPLTPTFPSANTSPTEEIETMDESITSTPAIGIDVSSFSEDENDGSSLAQTYSSSSNSSRSASMISIVADGDDVPTEEIAVQALIVSAQNLADQYRALLSRSPTPGPYLMNLPLPSPLHSHPILPSDTEVLAPLPLNIAQRSRPKQKQKRPSRRLSQKQPPTIPARQHKLSPTPERTLRKVKARHSLHKFIDDEAVSEIYEPFFKRSRLSECSTLVSSRENTPQSTPRSRTKELEAFPQIYVFDDNNVPHSQAKAAELDSERKFVNTPGVPPRSGRRPIPGPIPATNFSTLQIPSSVYKYLVPVAEKRYGGVEWEVWI